MVEDHDMIDAGARMIAHHRRLAIAAVGLGVILLSLLILPDLSSFVRLGLGLSAVLLGGMVITFWLSLLGKKVGHSIKRGKDAGRGAAKAETVTALLETLPESYVCLHGLNFDGFTIDHLVVGPGGLFLIEINTQDGRITSQDDLLLLNGRCLESDFIARGWSRADQLQSLLKDQTGRTWLIKPVLCFSDAVVEVWGTIKGVVIVNSNYLAAFIKLNRPTLGRDDCAQLAASIKSITKAAEPGNKVCPECRSAKPVRNSLDENKTGTHFYGCSPGVSLSACNKLKC